MCVFKVQSAQKSIFEKWRKKKNILRNTYTQFAVFVTFSWKSKLNNCAIRYDFKKQQQQRHQQISVNTHTHSIESWMIHSTIFYRPYEYIKNVYRVWMYALYVVYVRILAWASFYLYAYVWLSNRPKKVYTKQAELEVKH